MSYCSTLLPPPFTLLRYNGAVTTASNNEVKDEKANVIVEVDIFYASAVLNISDDNPVNWIFDLKLTVIGGTAAAVKVLRRLFPHTQRAYFQ